MKITGHKVQMAPPIDVELSTRPSRQVVGGVTGAIDGALVGARVGTALGGGTGAGVTGALVGCATGALVGAFVGDLVGALVVGDLTGASVVGDLTGASVTGALVGELTGASVGAAHTPVSLMRSKAISSWSRPSPTVIRSLIVDPVSSIAAEKRLNVEVKTWPSPHPSE